MGTRVVPTPNSPRKRGCRAKFAVLIAVPILLGAATCDNKPPPPSKQEQQRAAYSACVKADRSKDTQYRCQQHVFGQVFDSGDPRWDCSHMGDWLCDRNGK